MKDYTYYKNIIINQFRFGNYTSQWLIQPWDGQAPVDISNTIEKSFFNLFTVLKVSSIVENETLLINRNDQIQYLLNNLDRGLQEIENTNLYDTFSNNYQSLKNIIQGIYTNIELFIQTYVPANQILNIQQSFQEFQNSILRVFLNLMIHSFFIQMTNSKYNSLSVNDIYRRYVKEIWINDIDKTYPIYNQDWLQMNLDSMVMVQNLEEAILSWTFVLDTTDPILKWYRMYNMISSSDVNTELTVFYYWGFRLYEYILDSVLKNYKSTEIQDLDTNRIYFLKRIWYYQLYDPNVPKDQLIKTYTIRDLQFFSYANVSSLKSMYQIVSYNNENDRNALWNWCIYTYGIKEINSFSFFNQWNQAPIGSVDAYIYYSTISNYTVPLVANLEQAIQRMFYVMNQLCNNLTDYRDSRWNLLNYQYSPILNSTDTSNTVYYFDRRIDNIIKELVKSPNININSIHSFLDALDNNEQYYIYTTLNLFIGTFDSIDIFTEWLKSFMNHGLIRKPGIYNAFDSNVEDENYNSLLKQFTFNLYTETFINAITTQNPDTIDIDTMLNDYEITIQNVQDNNTLLQQQIVDLEGQIAGFEKPATVFKKTQKLVKKINTFSNLTQKNETLTKTITTTQKQIQTVIVRQKKFKQVKTIYNNNVQHYSKLQNEYKKITGELSLLMPIFLNYVEQYNCLCEQYWNCREISKKKYEDIIHKECRLFKQYNEDEQFMKGVCTVFDNYSDSQ